MSQSQPRREQSGSFGLALILVGIFFLVFAKDIARSGLTAENDPGPRAFPIAISLLMLVGGTWQLASSWRNRIGAEKTRPEAVPQSSKPASSQSGLWNVVFMVASLLIFLAMVYWAGFLLSTLTFAFAMTWWLGARGWHAALFSVVLVSLIYVLFVKMFEVALPSGLLDLTF